MKQITPSMILKRAKEILSKPRAWIKGRLFAKSDDGWSYDGAGADRFCSIGAILKADQELGGHPQYGIHTLGRMKAENILNEVIRDETKGGYGDIPSWNDAHHRKKAQILSAFTKAIKKAECEEKRKKQ